MGGIKMKLSTWSNSKEYTMDEIRERGHKILSVRNDGVGHIIEYRHSTLTARPRKGDLVEYYDDSRYRRGIVLGTDKDSWVIKDHIEVKGMIFGLDMVRKIITKQIIPKKLFRYMDVGELR